MACFLHFLARRSKHWAVPQLWEREMLTAEQIRAGRAILGWSASELADRAALHITTVRRLERCNGSPSGTIDSLKRIEDTLLAAGVEFTTSNGKVGVQMTRPLHGNGHVVT